MSAATDIQTACSELARAQKLVAELQTQCGPAVKGPPVIGSATLWARLETIDDRLHEALVKLGG
jgi:hypothetical protein